ncbi:Glyoxylase, beta-lactamase superfamily II [Polaromonas sp. OV174]|uniref:MBL fold metallo-hydrolase n=1 Tax=Polaromonas sp. OV174 TaxID=1855300 RepID=UPI0008E0D78C|nr:MBL fold metallo-hydrolase [Polaromonas sp. OV174]SFB92155.1 Glyoxylase, beta-lactamase superfamily II [Polaromonas sp. OV174]
MNLLEQQLDYPWGDTLPEQGASLELAPGIKWIRMALPFALDHINLWLLRDEIDDPDRPGEKIQGWSMVDCCISRDESKAQWEAIFSTQLEGLPILRVIVTHMHPDHIGLAYWLCQRWTTANHVCRLWISATDYQAACLASQSTTSFGGDKAARFFASHGLTDPESVEKIRGRTGYYPSMVPEVPPSFCRLMDGKSIRIGGRDWHCISGYGHAPEHIALHCAEAGLLISGDMVLPRISTNVSVYDIEPEADALTLFLTSIDKFLPLAPQTLVLPSHGKPFRGLQTRIRQLHDHHRDRLEEVLQACVASPCCAADILPIMFKRKLDLHQTTFAMGEALAHLHTLWLGGQLRRSLDSDGIYRFRSAPG